MPLINVLKSKIHRARITGLSLEYEGSITVDSKLMAEARLLPYEQVDVLNLNNGTRFATYVIEGEENSGQVCLNGAAARLAKKGDIVIILAYCQLEADEVVALTPRLVYVDLKNRITKVKHNIDTIHL
jgi:aspartate 1-decarboxylase